MWLVSDLLCTVCTYIKVKDIYQLLLVNKYSYTSIFGYLKMSREMRLIGELKHNPKLIANPNYFNLFKGDLSDSIHVVHQNNSIFTFEFHKSSTVFKILSYCKNDEIAEYLIRLLDVELMFFKHKYYIIYTTKSSYIPKSKMWINAVEAVKRYINQDGSYSELPECCRHTPPKKLGTLEKIVIFINTIQ